MRYKNTKCKFMGCYRTKEYNNLCDSHAKQKIRTGKTWVLGVRRYETSKLAQGCAMPGCDKIHSHRGFCASHVALYLRGKVAEEDDRQCEFPDCKLVHLAKGLCKIHYDAARNFEYTQWMKKLVS